MRSRTADFVLAGEGELASSMCASSEGGTMWRATGREELVVPAGAPAVAVSIRVGASTSDSGDAFTADRDWTGTCSAIPGGGAVPVPTTDVALHLFTPLG